MTLQPRSPAPIGASRSRIEIRETLPENAMGMARILSQAFGRFHAHPEFAPGVPHLTFADASVCGAMEAPATCGGEPGCARSATESRLRTFE